LEEVIYLDLETTGVGARDEIIEIGAVKVLPGGEEETYEQLVNPSVSRVSPHILKMCTGITEEKLRRAPKFAEIKEEFLDFITDYPLVCHNAGFEQRMLEKALWEKLPNQFLDSLLLFLIFKPALAGHNMDYLFKHYLHEELSGAHRALADARDTKKLVGQLLNDLSRDDTGILENTLAMLNGSDWNWLPYLREIEPATLCRTVGKRQAPFLSSSPSRGKPSCRYTLDRITPILEDESKWTEHFPGYRKRPQQIKMAGKVAEAFQQNRALFVEAPTGSGKTIAYLLAALIWAAREEEQVFISTNTKNLQQQLQDELPRLAEVLELAGMRFADMKGISNYICRRMVEEEAAGMAADLETRLARTYLANWARSSTSGEAEDISFWFKINYPALEALVNRARCRKEDCAGKDCSYLESCFYHRKVKAMKNSHICTINHSLLLTWPGNYPEMERLIIDEAHALEEKSFQAFTRELDSYELGHFLGRLVQGQDKGFLRFLQFHGKKHLPGLDIGPAEEDIAYIRQYIGDILQLLAPYLPEHENHSRRLEVPEDENLKQAALSLSALLESLADFLDDTMAAITAKDDGFEDSTLNQQGLTYISACRAWAGLLVECFQEEEDEQNCCYLECRQSRWSFRIAPLDVAEKFYSKVISNCSSMVLTSGTLAENNSYDRLARALGFEHLDDEALIFQKPLPNVYHYAQNSVLAIPDDSPGYRSPNFAAYAAKAVVGMATMLGGRVMVLFSSLERMEKVIEKVRMPLEGQGISVLGGKDAPKRADLESFKKDEHAVIFGSKSFYEGVDVKGPALSCVIIEKLSFVYPDDPLHKARSRYLRNKGLYPFYELDVPEVTRVLRQQFGRLLRSEDDKGAVIVLDQLGGGKKYCSDIIADLPEPKLIKDLPLESIIGQLEGVFKNWGYELD